MATLTVFNFALNMPESRIFEAEMENERLSATLGFKDGLDRYIFGGNFEYDDATALTQLSGNAVLTLSIGGTVTLQGVAQADLPTSLIINQ